MRWRIIDLFAASSSTFSVHCCEALSSFATPPSEAVFDRLQRIVCRVGQTGHTAVDGSLGYCSGHLLDQTRIHRLGNDVFATEFQIQTAVGLHDVIRHRLLGQLANRVHSGDLHFLVDAGCTNIQRTTEDEGEAQYVVDLVGVVGTTGRHDHVRTGSMGQLRTDFRIRVGAGKNDGVFSHQLELRRLQQIRTGQADEYVSTLDRIGQGALVGFVGEDRLVLVQVVATGMDHTLAINHADIFYGSTQTDKQLHAGHCGGAGSQADDLGVFQFLVRQLQRIEHGRRGNDGGTVLVIVEHGDIALLDQCALDLEALGRLDEIGRAHV